MFGLIEVQNLQFGDSFFVVELCRSGTLLNGRFVIVDRVRVILFCAQDVAAFFEFLRAGGWRRRFDATQLRGRRHRLGTVVDQGDFGLGERADSGECEQKREPGTIHNDDLPRSMVAGSTSAQAVVENSAADFGPYYLPYWPQIACQKSPFSSCHPR